MLGSDYVAAPTVFDVTNFGLGLLLFPVVTEVKDEDILILKFFCFNNLFQLIN